MDMTAILKAELSLPAGRPPPGVVPNMINPPSTGSTLVGVSSVLVVIMILFVLNRIYTKAFIIKRFTWDDGTCLLAALGAIVHYVMAIIGVKHCHIGVHIWDITIGQFLERISFIDDYVLEIVVSPSLGLIKVTFFILYLQIFAPNKYLRAAIWFGGIFTVLVYLSFSIAWFAIGTPSRGETWLSHFLGKELAKGNRLNFPIPALGLAIDIYILLLPLIGIHNLQLSLRRKIGVVVIFLTAIIAVVASILRLVYIFPIVHDPLGGDFTYNIMPVHLTIAVELLLGVIITCMPAFSCMLHHSLPPYEVLRLRATSIPGKYLRYRSQSTPKNRSRSGYKNSDNSGGSGRDRPIHRDSRKNDIQNASAKRDDFTDDQIYLNWELRQTSQYQNLVHSDHDTQSFGGKGPYTHREIFESDMV